MSELRLTSLHLQNFATFETQHIHFHDHFNAIVGETGSGKSLVLDALQLILGNRADKQIIRRNATFASVEATFESSNRSINDYFDSIGFPFEDEIIIKRVVYPTGKTKAFINHQSTNISTLTSFSKRFIDLVGQFENQKLLSEEYQMVLLDNYSNQKELKDNYRALFSQYNNEKSNYQNLIKKQEERIQRQDFLKYQLDELEKLNPSLEDEEQLLIKKESLLNIEDKKEVINKTLHALSENENGNILSDLNTITSQLEKTPDYINDSDLDSLFKASQIIEEVSYNLSKGINEESDQEQLETIIDRLDHYQKLKRKFGGTIESLLHSYQQFSKEFQSLTQIDKEIEASKMKLDTLHHNAAQLAEELHENRLLKGAELSKELTLGVRNLLMEGATIKLELSRNQELNQNGFTALALNAETNPGEGYFSLKKVASGGELSRILLTLRQIVAASDSISIFLFDEIDTGIGGETAICTGKALADVSKHSQVIAITHLPQIAFHADKLVSIEKSVSPQTTRTHSFAYEYTGEEKNTYINKMSQLN